MKILVTVLLTALFVFALATAWVDYVQPHMEQVARTTAEKAPAEPASPRKRARKPATNELTADPAEDEADLAESPPRKSQKTADQELESAALLAEKMDEVKRQESSLAARQEALRLIYDDIRAELAAVDEIRKRTNEDLAEAEKRILETAQPPRSNKTARSVPTTRPVAGQTSAVRADAVFIRHLVDQGKMETAVSVLKAMKGRDAAGVLTYLSSLDSKLALQLADRVQAISGETVRR